MRLAVPIIAVLCVVWLAWQCCRSNARPLPGQELYDAGNKLGWLPRADPFQPLGQAFYFLRDPDAATAEVLIKGRLPASGVLYARRTPGSDAVADLTALVVRGWELRGDAAMVDDLARELGP
jgi:hypothetical protein